MVDFDVSNAASLKSKSMSYYYVKLYKILNSALLLADSVCLFMMK